MLQNTLLCGKRHNIHTKLLGLCHFGCPQYTCYQQKNNRNALFTFVPSSTCKMFFFFCNVIIFIAQFPKNASSQAGHHVQDQTWTQRSGNYLRWCAVLLKNVLFFERFARFMNFQLISIFFSHFVLCLSSLWDRLLHISCDMWVGLGETPFSTIANDVAGT